MSEKKTNTGLVAFCESKIGLPYFYGAKMEVVTERLYNTLTGLYPSMYPGGDRDRGKIGKVCCDCSGLISAYTGVQRSSAAFREAGKESVHTINTIHNAPLGALVWKSGHIGVFAGVENGKAMYIAEDGSAWGCRKKELPGSFTHWFKCPDIEYIEENETAASDGTETATIAGTETAAQASVATVTFDTNSESDEDDYFSEAEILGAIDILKEANIIESPEYWRENWEALPYLDRLLTQVAKYVMCVTLTTELSEDYKILYAIIQAEAGDQDMEGRVMVGNVVMNRVKSEGFPNTIEGVVTQKGQFSPVANGSYLRCRKDFDEGKCDEMTMDAVYSALITKGGSQGALYFRMIKGAEDSWHERTLTKLFDHGDHRFYK